MTTKARSNRLDVPVQSNPLTDAKKLFSTGRANALCRVHPNHNKLRGSLHHCPQHWHDSSPTLHQSVPDIAPTLHRVKS